MLWLPIWQSCAKCTYAMIQLSLPTRVTPASSAAARRSRRNGRCGCAGRCEYGRRARRARRSRCPPPIRPRDRRSSTARPRPLLPAAHRHGRWQWGESPACALDRPDRAQDGRRGDELARDAGRARELADAAQLALEDDLDLELIPGYDRLLEPGVIDADVIVDRVLVGLGALRAEHQHAGGLGHGF